MSSSTSRHPILFVLRALGYGGAERQLAALACGLQSRGHHVTVLALYPGGPMAEELSRAGVELVTLGKRGRWDLLAPLYRFVKFARARGPGIIHGYLPDGNLLATLARFFSPGSALVWGVRGSDFDPAQYDWLYRLLFRVSCRFSRRADLIIANSAAGLAFHAAMGYPAAQMIVIPNGIDTERFRPNLIVRERQRSLWGIRPEHQLIGLVGRLDPMKDHSTFLRAAALVATGHSEARFVCVGNGPSDYQARLRRLAIELRIGEQVLWAPAQPEVESVYNALDVLALTSAFGEGFPNVVGEAMACGVRCVATSSGDSAVVVGETGAVVPVRDPVALGEACSRLLSAGSVGPDARCRARIVEEFGIEALLLRTEAALERALASP